MKRKRMSDYFKGGDGLNTHAPHQHNEWWFLFPLFSLSLFSQFFLWGCVVLFDLEGVLETFLSFFGVQD